MNGGEDPETEDPETEPEAEDPETEGNIPAQDPPSSPSPAEPTVRGELWEHTRDMSRVIGTLTIDAVFSVGVGYLNHYVDGWVEGLHLEGTSADVFWWVQLLLAVATIGAVAIRVVADLAVMGRRGLRRVRRG